MISGGEKGIFIALSVGFDLTRPVAQYVEDTNEIANAIAHVNIEEHVWHQQCQQGLMHADGTHAAYHDADKEIKHQERREGMQDIGREDTGDATEDQSEKEHQWEKLSDSRWRTQFLVH